MTLKIYASKKYVYIILAVLLIAIAASCVSVFAGKMLETGETQASGTVTGTVQGPAGTGPVKVPQNASEGYRAVCYDYDEASFIAAGTKGRIDRIRPDGTVTGSAAVTYACLNGAASMDGIDVAVGDGGVVLFSKDGGDFRKAKSGTSRDLYGVTPFNGSFLAAGASGTIISSPDGERWKQVKTGIKNTILSIAANDRMCMAVTKEGQILMSCDGRKWEVLDYNKFYEGYMEPCLFRSISACGDAFFIAGEYRDRPGVPAIISSDTGEIWREHVFGRINDSLAEEYYPMTVNAITADWDQLVAACSGGRLLTVTECITCNKLDALGDHEITALASADGYLALVGDGYWFDIQRSDAFRQYGISAVQALKDYENGAFIVDVRTDEEYAQLHIKGSIHIPVDELESGLEHFIPDKDSKIIFYCQKGVRAQKALEAALLMGYRKVYNLGGLADWPYDTETGGVSGAD